MPETHDNLTSVAAPSATAPPPGQAAQSSAAPQVRRVDAPRFDLALWQERVVDFLKTVVWVAPLTILVWVYAEREQIDYSRPPVAFPIEVLINDPNRVVTLKDPADHNVMATLVGPRTAMDRLIPQLTTVTNDRPAVQIFVGQKIKRGEHSIASTPNIAENPLFVRGGVSVKSVQPQYLQVEVDDYQDVDSVPVVAPADLPNIAATFAPDRVRLRAPTSVLDKARRDGSLKVIADLHRFDSIKEPGQHQESNVPLHQAFTGGHVTLGTTVVSATFETREKEETYEIPNVNVFVVMSELMNTNFTVDVNNHYPLIPNVKVQGPKEQIRKIRADETLVRGLLAIPPSPSEGEFTGTVTFQTPPGVRVIDDPERFKLRYRLASRGGT